MLLQVQNIDALDLCDAAASGDVDRVESLLASGVDPNANWEELDFAAMPDVEIFLTTGNDDIIDEKFDMDRYKAIGEEVIGAFEQAGYNLTELNRE